MGLKEWVNKRRGKTGGSVDGASTPDSQSTTTSPTDLANKNGRRDAAATTAPLSNPPSSDPAHQQTQASSISEIDALRNAVWKQAHERLRSEQPKLVAAYEALVKEQSGVPQGSKLDSDSMCLIVRKQKDMMQNKQWSYTWFWREACCEKYCRDHIRPRGARFWTYRTWNDCGPSVCLYTMASWPIATNSDIS